MKKKWKASAKKQKNQMEIEHKIFIVTEIKASVYVYSSRLEGQKKNKRTE